jgi:hypothetical protein
VGPDVKKSQSCLSLRNESVLDGGEAPHILNVGTRLRLSVELHTPATLPPGESPRYGLKYEAKVGVQAFLEDLEKMKTPWPYLESNRDCTVVQPVTYASCQLGAISCYINRVWKFVFSRHRAPRLLHAPLFKGRCLYRDISHVLLVLT